MIWPVYHPGFVTRRDPTLSKYSQVCPRTQCLSKTPREVLVVHPYGETPTRHTRLRHLENSRPDLPALPHACVVDVESFGGKVLTKFAKLEQTTELLFPPPKVLYCVGVDCFVSASVHAAIRLVVSIEIYASDCHTAFDRRLPDRALCGPTEVFEFPHTANVDRENSAVGAHTIGQTAMVPPPVTTMTTHIVNHIKSYSQPPLAAQYGLFHLMMW